MNKKPTSKTSFKQKISLLAFGLLVTFVALEIILRIGAVVFMWSQDRSNQMAKTSSEVVKVLCIGESTTALGGADAYPYQLEEVLNQKSNGPKFEVINKGVPAITTKYIAENIKRNIDKYDPDIVIAMMGINDREHVNDLQMQGNKRLDFLLSKFQTYKLISMVKKHVVARLEESGIVDSEEVVLDVEFDEFGNEVAVKNKGEYVEKVESLEDILEEIGQLTQAAEGLALAGAQAQAAGRAQEEKQILERLQIAEWRLSLDLAKVGLWYHDREEFIKAKGYYEKALAVEPNNISAQVGLGRTYKSVGKFEVAEGLFKKALSLKSDTTLALLELGRMYSKIGKKDLTAQFFRAVLNGPSEGNNDWIYLEIGIWFDDNDFSDEAEAAYKEVLVKNSDSFQTYERLLKMYITQKNIGKAEKLLKMAVDKGVKEPELYKKFAMVYRELGREDLVEENLKMYQKLEKNKYFPHTVENINAVVSTVLGSGKKFIAMQYPMRSAETLKNVIKANEKAVFVENKAPFEALVKAYGFAEVFEDSFAGDFGHCTRKGNRLIAERLTQTILSDVLNLK